MPQFDPRAVSAAHKNADWYAVMWDLRGLRYNHDHQGFRAIDPPPAYHSWATAIQGAPIEKICADYAETPDFAIKDAGGAADLGAFGLVSAFEASWIWHKPVARRAPVNWEVIETAEALAKWERAWAVTSPTSARHFPDQILARPDVAILGQRHGAGYSSGFVVNRSRDCLGVSNTFGVGVWPHIAALCGQIDRDLPLVGYEMRGDLDTACGYGWSVTGQLRVWVRPPL